MSSRHTWIAASLGLILAPAAFSQPPAPAPQGNPLLRVNGGNVTSQPTAQTGGSAGTPGAPPSTIVVNQSQPGVAPSWYQPNYSPYGGYLQGKASVIDA